MKVRRAAAGSQVRPAEGGLHHAHVGHQRKSEINTEIATWSGVVGVGGGCRMHVQMTRLLSDGSVREQNDFES